MLMLCPPLPAQAEARNVALTKKYSTYVALGLKRLDTPAL